MRCPRCDAENPAGMRKALSPLGEIGRIFEHTRDAECLAEALGDQRRLGWASAWMTHCFWVLGQQDRAIECGRRALDIAAPLGEFALQVVSTFLLGLAYHAVGDYTDAIRFARRALDLSRNHKERGHEAWVLRLLGEIASHPDPPDAETAEARYRQAMALASELGMRPLVAHCHLGLGTLYAKAGRQEEARAEITATIELYRSMDMTFWFPRAEASLAKIQ